MSDWMEFHLYEYCYRYLAGINSTLWSEAFDIKSDDGLEKAARWLAKTVEELEREIKA